MANKDLIAIIAGESPSLTPRSLQDSSELLTDLLRCWQIIPSISQAQLMGPLKEILPPAIHARLRNAWLAITAFSKAQIVASRPFVAALADKGIEYSLLKGSATSILLYPQSHMRAAWDLNIGVYKSDLDNVRALALDVGYIEAQQDIAHGGFSRSDPALRAAVEAAHYELGFLVKKLRVKNLSPEIVSAITQEDSTHRHWYGTDSSQPWCYASVDIHHAISLDIPLELLLETSRAMTVDNLTIRVPAYEWLAAHLIFKIYWEGVHTYSKGLYEYADLVRLMRHLDAPTFRRLIDILQHHNLVAAGHYVLRHMADFGIVLPDHICSFIDDSARPPGNADPVRLNDLGDMWPKLWGRR